MFDGEDWTKPRKRIAATPIAGIIALVVVVATAGLGDAAIWIYLPFGAVAGLLHLYTFWVGFHRDAENVEERTGKQPRWWAYSIAAFFLTSYLVAPIYLAVWRSS